MNTWIVGNRDFDHGSACYFGFTTEDRAYAQAARLIAEELTALCDLDSEIGPQLVTALKSGRYQDAVRLYHSVEGNLDFIDVECVQLDQFHGDAPLKL